MSYPSPTLLPSESNDVALTAGQRRLASRACFACAAAALAGSQAALLPLWSCPLAERLPLLRVVLFLLGVCQVAGIAAAMMLFRRSSARPVAAGRNHAVSATAAFESLFVADHASLSASELFAAMESPVVPAAAASPGATSSAAEPRRWWTDSGLRQENQQRLGR